MTLSTVRCARCWRHYPLSCTRVVVVAGQDVAICAACELRLLSDRLGHRVRTDELRAVRQFEQRESCEERRRRRRRPSSCGGMWAPIPDGAGVYVFRFPCGGAYVGSSWHLRRRIASQTRAMDQGRHPNHFVQEAWSSCGGIGLACTWRELPEVREPEELCHFENRLLDHWAARAPLLNIDRIATPYFEDGRPCRLHRPVGADGVLLEQSCASPCDAGGK